VVKLYFDVETYSEKPIDFKREPVFKNIEIRVICALRDYTSDGAPYSNARAEEVQSFTVKELGSEKAVLEAFSGEIKRSLSPITFIGFNILITLRMVKLGVDALENQYELWHNTNTIDYQQVLLGINNGKSRGINLRNVVGKANEYGLVPPAPQLYPPQAPSGRKEWELLHDWIKCGQYDEVERHCRQDVLLVRWIDLIGITRFVAQYAKTSRALFTI
jgi:hypothetical protein